MAGNKTTVSIDELGLPDGAREWVAKVEAEAGHALQIILDPDLDAKAEAKWDGGAPVVVVAPDGRNATTVAHEVSHLRLEQAGWPQWNIPLNPAVAGAAGLKPDQVERLASELQSVIEHASFFPDLIGMGLNPHSEVDGEVRGEFIPALKNVVPTPPEKFKLGLTGRLTALHLARAILEAGDQARAEVLAAADSLVHERAVAEKIAETVRNSSKTADGARDAMLRCWTALALNPALIAEAKHHPGR